MWGFGAPLEMSAPCGVSLAQSNNSFSTRVSVTRVSTGQAALRKPRTDHCSKEINVTRYFCKVHMQHQKGEVTRVARGRR